VTVAASLAFAFGAGLTTFVAPCVFPLLPGYLGFYADHDIGHRTTLPIVQGLTTAAGVLAVFGSLTTVIYVVDSRVLTPLSGTEPFAGGVLIVLGAVTLTGYEPSVGVPLPRRRDTALGLFVFGGVYAIAAAGCSIPILLAIVAQALAMGPTAGAAVIVAYALGVALPMVGATVAAGYGVDIVIGGGVSGETITRIAGATMLWAGVVQVWAGCSL
jgi:cytochrome c-type biogenesis protein